MAGMSEKEFFRLLDQTQAALQRAIRDLRSDNYSLEILDESEMDAGEFEQSYYGYLPDFFDEEENESNSSLGLISDLSAGQFDRPHVMRDVVENFDPLWVAPDQRTPPREMENFRSLVAEWEEHRPYTRVPQQARHPSRRPLVDVDSPLGTPPSPADRYFGDLPQHFPAPHARTRSRTDCTPQAPGLQSIPEERHIPAHEGRVRFNEADLDRQLIFEIEVIVQEVLLGCDRVLRRHTGRGVNDLNRRTAQRNLLSCPQ